MKKRPLSEEEILLWQQIAATTKPLLSEMDMTLEELPVAPPVKVRPAVRPPKVAVNTELAPGGYAGIDRNTAERFRKGDYPIDATLDLHGMSREKAHHALVNFVQSHYQQGSRCLLAITGKGVRQTMQDDPGRGILRELLPVWLAEPGIRPMVLAFDVAKQKHGGSGAYYILLRRKR